MPSTNEIVEALYEAWRTGDFEAVRRGLDDEVEHTVHFAPAINRFGGTTKGRAATEERLAALGAEYEILAFDNGPILVNGDEAATRVRMRYRHRKTGEILDTVSAHFWTLANGRVVQFDEYHDDAPIEAFSRICGERG
jgi:uncharacterized protein